MSFASVALLVGVVTVLLIAWGPGAGGHSGILQGTGTNKGEIPTIVHGELDQPVPQDRPSSEPFQRLGSVALNTTPCLHGSSHDITRGFTCAHDLYNAYLSAHAGGVHFETLYEDFAAYFDKRAELLPHEMGGQDLIDKVLAAHGIDEETYATVCGSSSEDPTDAGKARPLEDARDLPSAFEDLAIEEKIAISSTCRFAPFFEEDRPWVADYHEGHHHDDAAQDHDPDHDHDHDRTPYGPGSDAEDIEAIADHGHGHGVHGVTLNDELDWAYAALSHQSKVAIINLNVINWQAVAQHEDETGHQVLLVDDTSPFSDEALLNYASRLLLDGYDHEDEMAQALDTVHRYCFNEAHNRWDEAGIQRPWTDDLGTPPGLEQRGDEELGHAIRFIGNHTSVPHVENPPRAEATGWTCFLAFTGIDVRTWTDPKFTNEHCWYDTRDHARYDALHSPGDYSRSNTLNIGDGDAWRCDWFVRYVQVAHDIELDVSVPVPVEVAHDLPLDNLEDEHVTREKPDWEIEDLDAAIDDDVEWVNVTGTLNISIGPHEIDYNPHNGLVYASHYWLFPDPDVRMLPDWWIHTVDQNPASPAFNNPWDTQGGPATLSANAAFLDGRSSMAGTSLGTTQLLAGGHDDAYRDEILRYNAHNDGVRADETTLPTPRTGLTMLLDENPHEACTDRCVYMIGGHEAIDPTGDRAHDSTAYTDEILWYDPLKQTFATPDEDGNLTLSHDPPLEAPSHLPSPRAHAASIWTGEEAYILGGQNETGILDEIVRYHPANGTVEPLNASLPTNVTNAAAVWTGQQAYLLGGENAQGPVDEIVRFDPRDPDATTHVASLPTPLSGPSAVWTGEAILVFGGHDGQKAHTSVLEYVPGSSVNQVSKLPSARADSTAAWNGTHAFLLGGVDRGDANSVTRYYPPTGETVTSIADARGTPWMRSQAYPIDVGGPVDGLHPVTVNVDEKTGLIFTANRESNTLSVLSHDGERDFTSNLADAQLQGPMVFNVKGEFPTTESLRGFDFYQWANDTQLPDPSSIGTIHDVDIPQPGVNSTLCAPFDEIEATHGLEANRTYASDICKAGLLDTRSLDPDYLVDVARDAAEEHVQRFLQEETPWPQLQQDIRGLVDRDDEHVREGIEHILDAWEHRLSDGDAAFLKDALNNLATVQPSQRGNATLTLLQEASQRLPGPLDAFLDDFEATVEAVANAEDLEEADEHVRTFKTSWRTAARTGNLVGFQGASLDLDGFVQHATTSLPYEGIPVKTAAEFIAFCVTYAPGDVLPELVTHDEKDAREHPVDCALATSKTNDQGQPLEATADYAGHSNNHDVMVIRNNPAHTFTVRPAYDDVIIQPPILQPFDVWINPETQNIWVSNMGNHDNLPITQGWLSMVVGECDTKMGNELVGRLALPGVNAPFMGNPSQALDTAHHGPTDQAFRSIANAEFTLPLEMGITPHHIDINPYTQEVYGGHLVSPFIQAAQVECPRIDWGIEKSFIYGSDTLPGHADVPIGNPTGISANPATERLFFTRFTQDDRMYFPATGKKELISDYTGVVDLRNYSLTDASIFGGDHHLDVDRAIPPALTFADPFWNQTKTYHVGDETIVGNRVLAGETGNSIQMPWRCTYYAAAVDPQAPDPVNPGADGITYRDQRAIDMFHFDAGRCFNLFDLQEDAFQQAMQGDAWSIFPAPEGHEDAYGDPGNLTEDRKVYWEPGFERLSFGQVHLFVDPDDVSPRLRVEDPHARDDTRAQVVDGQSSEELAAAWVESNRDEPATIPKGTLKLTPDYDEAGGIETLEDLRDRGAWNLTFDTRALIETPSPPRVLGDASMDNMLIEEIRDTGASHLAEWTARDPCCQEEAQTTLPITAPIETGNESIRFTFDAGTLSETQHAGWIIHEVALRDDATGQRVVYNLAKHATAEGMVTLYEGSTGSTVAFHDASTGTYQTPQEPAQGSLTIYLHPDSLGADVSTFEEPMLELRHEQRVRASQGPGPAYDRLAVQASHDGGNTWRDVWTHSSEQGPIITLEDVNEDITGPVHVATGEFEHHAYATPWEDISLGDLAFRLSFDAVDPVLTHLPGWTVGPLSLQAEDGTTIPLSADHDVYQREPGEEPEWNVFSRTLDGSYVYTFTNEQGTYDHLTEGMGGPTGQICRLTPGESYGQWSGLLNRKAGTGPVKAHARDLAGNTGSIQADHGGGIVLVEDSFESPTFTEAYWTRKTVDPSGVGFAAYVFDPTPQGQGDTTPEDTPFNLEPVTIEGKQNHGPGEILLEPRDLLVETGPLNVPHIIRQDFTTEGDALLDDGPQYKRAFLLSPDNVDYDRVSPGLQQILAQEGMFLNATHVFAEGQAPDPVQMSLIETQRFLDQVRGTDQMSSMGEGELDLERILEGGLSAARMTAPPDHYGIRDVTRADPVQDQVLHMGVEDYVLDGTPDVPQLAGERLEHAFNHSVEDGVPDRISFALDIVPRHRMAETLVHAQTPLLGEEVNLGAEVSMLEFVLGTVPLGDLDIGEDDLAHLLGDHGVAEGVANDAAWLAEHTLEDLGLAASTRQSLVEELLRSTFAVGLQVGDLLSMKDRLQMPLPTYGETYSVRAMLETPNGERVTLDERDGLFLDKTLDMDPEGTIAGDARVTFGPAEEGAYETRLSMDVNRVEKLRLDLTGEDARALMNASGEHKIVLESAIRSGDAPAPGIVYEIAYSGLSFTAHTNEATHEDPHPRFAWVGPTTPGAPVGFLPADATPLLQDHMAQDGHVTWYNWTFPTAALTGFDPGTEHAGVFLNGIPLVLDEDDDRLDDFLTNPVATAFGQTAQKLTVVRDAEAGTLTVSYQAAGCHVPVPSAPLAHEAPIPVTLEVGDDRGASSQSTEHVLTGGNGRAPEIIVDPFPHKEDPNASQLIWQDNTGSMFLGAQGTSLNLTNETFLDVDVPGNLTYDELRDHDTLLEALNATALEQETRFTIEDVEQAATDGEPVIGAVLNATDRSPDLLYDWLLTNPGEVLVVGEEGHDATNGTRVQTQLGQLPDPMLSLLPEALPDADVGLPKAPPSDRSGHESVDPTTLSFTEEEICVEDNGALEDFCTPRIDDALTLLDLCGLDAWALTFSLHPSKQGEPDPDETIARIVVMDTGIGPVQMAALDADDVVVHLSTAALENAQTLADAALTDINPLATLGALTNVIEDAQARSNALESGTHMLASVHEHATAPGQDPSALENVARHLRIDHATLLDSNATLDTLQADIHDAITTTKARLDAIHHEFDGLNEDLLDALDLWCTGPFPDVHVGPIQDDLDALSQDAQIVLDDANTTLEHANETLMSAVDALEEAHEAAEPFAQDWDATLTTMDPDEVNDAIREDLEDANQALTDARRHLETILDDLLDLLDAPILADVDEITEPTDDLLLSIKYDATTGEVLLRAGDTILKEDTLPEDSPTHVHPSFRWVSTGNRTAEVQSIWAGQGATLIDGFNDGPLDPDAWNITKQGPDDTHARAWADTVAPSQSPVHQFITEDRSLESDIHRLTEAVHRGEAPEPAATHLEPPEDPFDHTPRDCWGPTLWQSWPQTFADRIPAGVDLPPLLCDRFDVEPDIFPFNKYRAAMTQNVPDQTQTTHEIKHNPDELDQLAAHLQHALTPSEHLEHEHAYAAVFHQAPGAIEEIRVASGPGPWSAPAIQAPPGPPPAPFIFDVREIQPANGDAHVLIAFEPTGHANPPIDAFEAYTSTSPPHPEGTTDKHHLGTVHPDEEPPVGDWAGKPGFIPGEDYHVLNVTLDAFPPDQWRYITVRAENDNGGGPFSTPYRLPPTLVEERFSMHTPGNLDDQPGATVDDGNETVHIQGFHGFHARLDPCLGDRVAATSAMNHPHEQVAADWSQALHLRESGLGGLFSLALEVDLAGNESLDEIPLNLSSIDQPLDDVDLSLCNALESLLTHLDGHNADTVLEGLNIETNEDLPAFDPTEDPTDADMGTVLGFAQFAHDLHANASLDLDVGDLPHGEPTTVTWHTRPPQGAYHASLSFLVPSLLTDLAPAGPGDTLDPLQHVKQLGLVQALVTDERFHLLQIGHEGEDGFQEIARVDLDPRPAGAFNAEEAAEHLDHALAGHQHALSPLLDDGIFPLQYGVHAGDTPTNDELVAIAQADRWHTLDVYAPSQDANRYAVQLDGQWIGQFRTADDEVVPNAIRIGGSNLPMEIYVDDVRFADAIHPPAPRMQTVRMPAEADHTAVRWHLPEDGGAPLSDVNLLRIPLTPENEEAGASEIVAHTSGALSFLTDPASFNTLPGQRYAYAVQAVNDLRDEPRQLDPHEHCEGFDCGLEDPVRSWSPVSEARGVVLPGFLPVSEDASVAKHHALDHDEIPGLSDGLALPTGGLGPEAWRSVLHVNASQLVDARGHHLGPRDVGSATLMVYQYANQPERGSMFIPPPTVLDVLGAMGYNDHMRESIDQAVTFQTQEDAARAIEQQAPGLGQYLITHYGEDTYNAMLDGLEGERLIALSCPELQAGPFEAQCYFAFPYTLSFQLCSGMARELEVQQIPFNCWEDSIAAYPHPDAAYGVDQVTWSDLPEPEEGEGIDRQHPRSETWRHFDLTHALIDHEEGGSSTQGDLSVMLKQTREHAPAAMAVYASTKADSWITDTVGSPSSQNLPWVDGAGPDRFPWTTTTASSGDRALKLEGHGEKDHVSIRPTGIATVPFDVPITMDVFIPEGQAPREIGLELSANLVTRSENVGDRSCQLPPPSGTPLRYPTFDTTRVSANVVWGDAITHEEGGLERGLTATADLQTPLEGMGTDEATAMLQAGGVPMQRGQWVTLTFDPVQLVLEYIAQRDAPHGPISGLLDDLGAFTGTTNPWMPGSLMQSQALHERGHPTAFQDRVDTTLPDISPLTGGPIMGGANYNYWVQPWLASPFGVPWAFELFHHDKFVDLFHCALALDQVSLYAHGGTVLVDDIGPDISPKLRVDAGWTTQPTSTTVGLEHLLGGSRP